MMVRSQGMEMIHVMNFSPLKLTFSAPSSLHCSLNLLMMYCIPSSDTIKVLSNYLLMILGLRLIFVIVLLDAYKILLSNTWELIYGAMWRVGHNVWDLQNYIYHTQIPRENIESYLAQLILRPAQK